MPILRVVLCVSILHELVVAEDCPPIFFVFHLFSNVLSAAVELFDRDLETIEILENEVGSIHQVVVLPSEDNVNQMVARFVIVLGHFVHYL